VCLSKYIKINDLLEYINSGYILKSSVGTHGRINRITHDRYIAQFYMEVKLEYKIILSLASP